MSDILSDSQQRFLAELERLPEEYYPFLLQIVAHTEADRRKVGKIMYGQINRAINLLEPTFQRYSLLIHGRVCDPLVPLDDIDVRADLKKIWP